VANQEVLGENWPSYFAELGNLPADRRLRAVVLHPTDIIRGLHKELRRFGVPLLTLGNAWDEKFMERFYALILQFRFLTSATIGSQVFLAEEAGVQSFLLGNPRKLAELDTTPFSESNMDAASLVFRPQSRNADSDAEIERALAEYLGTDLGVIEYRESIRALFLEEIVPFLVRWVRNRMGIYLRKLVRQIYGGLKVHQPSK
jgi:hypothetical protein